MVRSIEQEIRDLHELFGSSRDPEGLAFVPLADAYRRSGDTTRALVLLTDGRARHPDLPAASLVEALVRRDLGDSEGAEEAFRRVLELDPDNARALVGLGRVLARRRSDDAEGQALLRRGLTLDPGLAAEEGGEEDGEAGSGEPESEEVGSGAVDDGMVDPTELAPSGFDGEVADPDGSPVDDPWADAAAGDEVATWEEGVPGEDVDAAGIDLDLTDPSEAGDAPTEELHIQWDAEAAFEPFDGGLYGGSEAFDAGLPGGDAAQAGPDAAAADALDQAGFEVEAAPEVGSLPTGDVAPEELLMELSDLAPDLEPGVPPAEEDDDEEEVLPTRTLAELYLRQGLLAEAVEVYEELVDRSPDDWALQARLEEVRAQMTRGRGGAPGPAEAPAGPPVREFLDRLLAWRPHGGGPGSEPE